ncbi:MAG: type II secretion system F family protein [Planctomycetales bacterium]|nr:type II secretion system F family protein [bacterium]UNM07213.1 MAG: type II secretion system F family protein [Planctomycetales bacterium]
MKTFVYTAKDSAGKVIHSQVEADNPKSVVEALRQEGFFVTRIVEKRRAFNPFVFIERLFKVGLKELTIFSRQFALLLNAGLTLSEAIDTIEEQTQNNSFREILHRVKLDIQSGTTLASSMQKQPRAFSLFFVSMVHAGEIGGALDSILERVAQFYENELELKNKVKSAMVYPITVTVFALGISLFMLMYIVPQFAAFYSDFSGGSARLPALTRKMMELSDWLLEHWPWLLLIPVAIILFVKFRNSKWGHILLDPIVLRIPIFGPLARKVAITRFTRTFGTLTQSGVPILEALEVSKNTASNNVIKRAIEYTRERIREGETIHGPMKRTKVFPPLVTNLISVGEEAGNLEEILFKISDYYDAEIDATIRALASLIEPLMIVVIGGIVGVIVVSLYLPIFNLVNIIQ